MNRGLIEILGDIEDPRRGNGIRHDLVEVLTIALLASLCGCAHFTEMELFGIEREEWLRGFLKLENGIPSHDTFGDIFAVIDPEQTRQCLIEWVETIRQRTRGEVVAIDGKTIRGSRGEIEGRRAIHVVSAWAAENGLVLGEVAVEEKSNEITAIPSLPVQQGVDNIKYRDTEPIDNIKGAPQRDYIGLPSAISKPAPAPLYKDA